MTGIMEAEDRGEARDKVTNEWRNKKEWLEIDSCHLYVQDIRIDNVPRKMSHGYIIMNKSISKYTHIM